MKPELTEQFHPNGNLKYKEWYLDGHLHNEEGPAWISYLENGNICYQAWWINGKRHNEEGPAIIEYEEDGKVECQEWWINGKEFSKEDFTSLDMIKKMDAFRLFSAIEIARFKI
jgi:antitoxin component YwqK of YwqJK toxin-antitoxin module